MYYLFPIRVTDGTRFWTLTPPVSAEDKVRAEMRVNASGLLLPLRIVSIEQMYEGEFR